MREILWWFETHCSGTLHRGRFAAKFRGFLHILVEPWKMCTLKEQELADRIWETECRLETMMPTLLLGQVHLKQISLLWSICPHGLTNHRSDIDKKCEAFCKPSMHSNYCSAARFHHISWELKEQEGKGGRCHDLQVHLSRREVWRKSCKGWNRSHSVVKMGSPARIEYGQLQAALMSVYKLYRIWFQLWLECVEQ